MPHEPLHGAYAKAVTLTDVNSNGRIDPGEETSKESVKRWQASIRYDRFFSANNKGYILGIIGSNEIAGKDLYFGGQLGYSRQLYKSEMHELLLEAGLDFSREQYIAPVGGKAPDPLNILSVRAFFGDGMKFSKDTGLVLGVGALAWSSGSVSHAPTTLMFPAMMLVSAVGMLAQSAVRRGAAELDDHRRRYLDHLGALADQLTDTAARQHDSLVWVHPEPSALWTVADGPRLFERAPDDSDFGHVRVGVGAQRLGRRITLPPTPPAHRLDPVSVAARRR